MYFGTHFQLQESHYVYPSVTCLTVRPAPILGIPHTFSAWKGTAHNLHSCSTLTCKSRNTVYVITCTKCKVQYVGMSSQPLKARFTQHLRKIQKHRSWKTNWETSRLYRHFCKADHLPHHITVQQVEDVPEGGNTLKARESHWMTALMTIEPHGLNIR